MPRRSVKLEITMALSLTVCVESAAQAYSVGNWSFGSRLGYIAVGGQQLEDLDNGMGATLFVSRSLANSFRLEFGTAWAYHGKGVICTSACYPQATVQGALYVRPTFVVAGAERGRHVYLGPQVGMSSGDFNDAAVAFDLGGALGVLVPVAGRLGFEASATGSAVTVGSTVFRGPNRTVVTGRSPWGMWLALKVGVTVNLSNPKAPPCISKLPYLAERTRRAIVRAA